MTPEPNYWQQGGVQTLAQSVGGGGQMAPSNLYLDPHEQPTSLLPQTPSVSGSSGGYDQAFDRQAALIQALRGFNPQAGGGAPPASMPPQAIGMPPTPTPPFNPQAGGLPPQAQASLPPQAMGGGRPAMPALPPQAMGGGRPNFAPGAGLPPQAQATLPPQAMGGGRPIGVGAPSAPGAPIMPAQVPAGRGRR